MGAYGRRGSKGIITLLDRFSTIVQNEMVGIEATAQLAIREEGRRRVPICSDSIVALTASQNMTMESNLTLECRHMLNSFANVQAVDCSGYLTQRNQEQQGWERSNQL